MPNCTINFKSCKVTLDPAKSKHYKGYGEIFWTCGTASHQAKYETISPNVIIFIETNHGQNCEVDATFTLGDFKGTPYNRIQIFGIKLSQ